MSPNIMESKRDQKSCFRIKSILVITFHPKKMIQQMFISICLEVLVLVTQPSSTQWTKTVAFPTKFLRSYIGLLLILNLRNSSIILDHISTQLCNFLLDVILTCPQSCLALFSLWADSMSNIKENTFWSNQSNLYLMWQLDSLIFLTYFWITFSNWIER